MLRSSAHLAIPLALGLAACGDTPTVDPLDTTGTGTPTQFQTTACPAPGSATGLAVLGCAGHVRGPLTGEVAAIGSRAYTSTWSVSTAVNPGNRINVWNVAGATPVLIDTLVVPGVVARVGDVSVSDDGRMLVAPTEPGGTLAVYELSAVARPRLVSQWAVPGAQGAGVHTAKLARVNGVQYAFAQLTNGRLYVSIVDLSDPAAPREAGRIPAANFIHDVFVRDGLVFASDWDEGLAIWDIGGGGRGGTVANPALVSRTPTVGGNAHNAWWFIDPIISSATTRDRYVFVGEEQAGTTGSSSRGDVHVLDISNRSAPREVAFYHLENAGAHNFWMDEQNGILYAAFYNGGVRALNVRGDLGTCTDAQKSADGRCDLGKMGREVGSALSSGNAYVWGVQLVGDALYASDMLNGLWKLRPIGR